LGAQHWPLTSTDLAHHPKRIYAVAIHGPALIVRHDQLDGLGGVLAGAAAKQGTVAMTEPGVVLDAVQTAMADLAVVLAAVRSGLDPDDVRAGRHLEMGEMDLLSARDAVEKACLEINVAETPDDGVRVTVPAPVRSIVLLAAAPHSVPVPAESPLAGRRRAGTPRRRCPGVGQGELFSVHDVPSRAIS